MKVAVASDHRGVEFRKHIRDELMQLGLEVVDMGTDGGESVDYPDYAAKVARAVALRQVDRGVLTCGTGIGMSLAANKVKGVRAAVVHDRFTAERSRSHNDANVLCLGAEVVKVESLGEIIRTWFATPFEGGRHQRRVDKIEGLEAGDP